MYIHTLRLLKDEDTRRESQRKAMLASLLNQQVKPKAPAVVDAFSRHATRGSIEGASDLSLYSLSKLYLDRVLAHHRLVTTTKEMITFFTG